MAETQRMSRLGRGLGALLTDHNAGREPEAAEAGSVVTPFAGSESAPVNESASAKPIEMLRRNPSQPRRQFDEAEIESLSDSIREKGVLQPILVRPVRDVEEAYEIVAGERRWRAAQKAGLTDVPVIVKDLDDREVLEVAIVENVQRQDLNPVEEGAGYRALADRFGHSHGAIAKAVGKSRAHVANMIRLLNLPDGVLEKLQAGQITTGHARPLIGLKDADDLADKIVAKGLTVRQAEDLAAGRTGASGAGGFAHGAAASKDADTVALENDLAEALGLTVNVKRTGAESGQLSIAYTSLEQLDDLCRRLSARR